jgi:hypothetical protein
MSSFIGYLADRARLIAWDCGEIQGWHDARMDLAALSLPDWMPWWAVVAVLVPVAFYLALFLLMPFSTFGLRAKLREMEGQIEALHEEVRSLTLRLPERGFGPARGLGADDYAEPPLQPPIPPAAREPRPGPAPRGGGFGDPMADRMLAYMRDKAQSDLDRAGGERAEPRPVRPRAEPRFVPPPREAELPPPPPLGGSPPEAPEPDLPPPPRLPPRFGRRRDEDEGGPPPAQPGGPRIDWPR